MGECFGDLAHKSPELQEEFLYNSETQRNLVSILFKFYKVLNVISIDARNFKVNIFVFFNATVVTLFDYNFFEFYLFGSFVYVDVNKPLIIFK